MLAGKCNLAGNKIMSEQRKTHCVLEPEPTLSSSATIIKENGAGLIVFGKNDVVLFANKAAGKLLGRPVHELLGKSSDFPWAGNNGCEFIFHRQDCETMAIEVRMLEMEWGGEIARLAFLQDITDRRCTEEALKSAI
jgi:PAS domain-containing protein